MKNNLGELSLHGFLVGFACCFLLGAVIYRQFSFKQEANAQDVSAVHSQDIERKLAATQMKLEAIEKRVKDLELKAATPLPRPVQRRRKP